MPQASPIPDRLSHQAGGPPSSQTAEPTIKSFAIDTHIVHYGTMSLRARGNGHIIEAGDHPMARITTLAESAAHLSLGNPATVRIFIMNVMIPGKVAKIGVAGPGGRVPVEIALTSPLPAGSMSDDDVDAAIEYGRIEKTHYMVWGSLMKQNSEGVVFRVEPDGKHANRVNASFGVIASELIEIKDGLQLGDKVIISDMTSVSTFSRVRIG